MIDRIIALTRSEIGDFRGRLFLARLLLRPIPAYSGYRVRARVLRAAGFKIGAGAFICDLPVFVGSGNIYERLILTGNNVVSWGVVFDLSERITLGEGAALSPQVALITSGHHYDNPRYRLGKVLAKPITVEAGAWCGTRSTLLPGVTVGEGAIIAAGAVVTKDIPPHTLAGGIPAKVIRNLDSDRVAKANGRQAQIVLAHNTRRAGSNL